MTKETSNTEKAVKGAHSQTAVVVLKGVLALAYFSVMSRLLTPVDFGYFALITAVTTILGSLSEAGLGSAVIQKKNADKKYISTAFSLSICLGTFFSILLLSFSRQFSELVCGTDELSLAFKIMSSMIFIQSVNNVAWAVFMRNLDFFKFGIIQITSDLLSYVTGIIFALKGFGFYSIVAASITSPLFLSIILIVLRKIDFTIIFFKPYIKEIVNYGGWLTATVILRNLTNEIDKVIIGRMLPITVLGSINRPSGFVSRISTQVNSIFDTVLFPILSSINDDKNTISRAYIKIMSLMVTLSFLLGSVVSLSSNIIIDIFFGSQWEYLRPVLIIFSIAMMLHGFSRICDSFFRSLGILKQYFMARLINWFVAITLVWAGCHYGMMGAVTGIVTGSLCSVIIKFLMQKKDVNVSAASLLKGIFANIWFITAVFVLCLILMLNVMYGEYIGIILFSFIIVSTIIFTPRIYGSVFREVVIYRYLKKLEKLRIY